MEARELGLWPGQPMRIYSVPELDPAKWLTQLKKNGHRAIIRCGEDGAVRIFERHGRGELTAAKKHDWSWLNDLFAPPFVLDGELVGPRQAGTKNYKLVLWDYCLPDFSEEALYEDRLVILEKMVAYSRWKTVSVIASYPVEQWQTLWSSLTDPDGENEGLVFKRSDIPLAWHTRPGVEDPNQLKLRRKG